MSVNSTGLMTMIIHRPGGPLAGRRDAGCRSPRQPPAPYPPDAMETCEVSTLVSLALAACDAPAVSEAVLTDTPAVPKSALDIPPPQRPRPSPLLHQKRRLMQKS